MGFKTVALAFAGGIAAANLYQKARAGKAAGEGFLDSAGLDADGSLPGAFDATGGTPTTESIYAADSVLGQPGADPAAMTDGGDPAENASPSAADFPRSDDDGARSMSAGSGSGAGSLQSQGSPGNGSLFPTSPAGEPKPGIADFTRGA